MQKIDNTLLTTETVSAGHPDKVADQIAAIFLDFFLAKDSNVKVACEVFVNKNRITIGGEMKSKILSFNIHHEKMLKSKILSFLEREIGYNQVSWKALGRKKLDIDFLINEQSREINSLLKENNHLGAGDNSTVFGFATNTPQTNYFPPFQKLANMILQKIDYIRHQDNLFQNEMQFAPDGKIQIAFAHNSLVQIVLCQQFLEEGNLEFKINQIKKEIIFPLAKKLNIIFAPNFQFFLKPFFLGGPAADSGVTGRKILIDNYGTFAYNGGGSFSGKDPSKSDLSLALFARFVAKHLVALNLGFSEITIQVSSIIGNPNLVNITCLNFDSCISSSEQAKINKIIQTFFSWSFEEIIEKLHLKSIRYLPYTKYSYFGNDTAPWEQLSLLSLIHKSKIFHS